ncbi:hypothetical protein DYB36_012429 [Aphanomyces astaci]|uniref:Uncharacterized protein n=1 Tax=Aphanomyces astaci TaxID=112090 RepID=A0A397AYU9_APHAT|nr:hypothetical protein DYB36_012429 [Aphanomyces astaci]
MKTTKNTDGSAWTTFMVPSCSDTGAEENMLEKLLQQRPNLKMVTLMEPLVGQLCNNTTFKADAYVDIDLKIQTKVGPVKIPGKALAVVRAALTEWVSINLSTNEVVAKAIPADIESNLKAESAAVSRAHVLVQASLSDTVRHDITAANLEKCAHCIIIKLRSKKISVYQRLHSFKFRPHASLDVNLQAFDKLRTEVEKLLEGHPLSDSNLASALLKVLPTCIMQDYYMWRGPKPSIPYQDMRRLLEKHRPDLTLKYPSILGPASIALTVPVHGSATATATTRSRAFALPAFRAGSRHRDGYGQAGAVPWGTKIP